MFPVPNKIKKTYSMTTPTTNLDRNGQENLYKPCLISKRICFKTILFTLVVVAVLSMFVFFSVAAVLFLQEKRY